MSSGRYQMTDTLLALAQSGQLSEDELERTSQQLLDSITAFSSLRKEETGKAGSIILINIDRAIREHKARPVTESEKITCRDGCSHCCMIPVGITIPEAVAALNYAEVNGVEIDEVKLRRQARYGIDTWFDQPKGDLACVFLKEHRCTIYSARPAACRKHFSQGDPDACDVANLGPNSAMMKWVVPLAEVIYSAVMNIFRPGTLPKVLLIALGRRQKGGTA